MNRTAGRYLLKSLSAAVICFLATALAVPCFSMQISEDEFTYVVAQDGSGDFVSIQEAIDASKAFPPERVKIFLKEGVYNEKVKVHSWNTRLSLIGENKETTIITYNDYFDKIDRGRNSTFHTYTLLVEGNDFLAENLTVENSAGPMGQAVALHVEADRSIFKNCRFLGNQDTIYAAGEGSRQYFEDCYIEGTTDFIFGGATAVFENCTIHSKSNSYITAASTPKNIDYGFVIKNSRLTSGQNVDSVYLGRPWRDFARTVFLNTHMGSHIRPEGWHNWNRPEAEKTVFYAEYGNTGPGYQPSERVSWSNQLSEQGTENYRLNQIFKGWNPKEVDPK